MSGFGWGEAAKAVTQIGGQMIANNANRKGQKRQYNYQRNLMDLQTQHQRSLNEQGREIQMQMWNDTNVGAQMEHMEKAGLNIGMMYGGAGSGGGGTTGSQGGGSAAGGSAQAAPQMSMDIGNAIMQAEQVKLMNAQAEKLKAEAASIRGEEGTQGETQIAEGLSRIEKLKAETTNEELKQLLTQAQTTTETQRSGQVLQDAILKAEQIVKVARENRIGEDTIEAAKQEIIGRAAGIDITNDLNRERIKLTQQQDEQIENAIAQKWNEISLHDTEVNIKIAQAIIQGIGTIGGTTLQAGRLAEIMKKAKEAASKSGTWRKNE